MEVARPDEREHGAGEAADEAHEYGEVRYGYGHEHGAQDDGHAERQAPDFELAVQVPDAGVRGGGRPDEEGLLEYVARRVVRQRVRQQHLDHQEHVDQALEGGRVQVVGDHLLRVVLEREEAHVAEQRLEYGGRDVAPLEHPVELGPVDEVTLERGQEYLRRVAEHDHAQRYGEVFHVDGPLDLAPAPVGQLEHAVPEYDDVDEYVRHGAPEAQQRHVVQVLEEPERYEQHARDHHPAARVDHAVRERALHQVAARHHVQDARHQQLDHLGHVHGPRAPHRPEALARDRHVRVAHPHPLPRVQVQLVQALHQYLARVAAYVRDPDHGHDGPVASAQHRERQRHHEHSLRKHTTTYYYHIIVIT